MTDQPDPVEAIGSPMMATLVEPGQMQFAASGGLSALSLPSSTSLASSLQGIPSAGNMAMHHAAIAASNGASMSLQDFGSLTHSSDSTQYAPAPKRQRIGSARESYSTLDPQSDISSVLREQPQLAEELNAIAFGDVSADPQSLRFSYPEADDSPPPKATHYQKKGQLVYREQDRFVPINNISRVMRKAIPKNGKVSKDAKECMQECVSEFVSFLTSEASDRCIDEKRKTITGDDILYSLSTLGFDNYVKPLQLYLKKYRDYLKEDKQQGGAKQDGDRGERNVGSDDHSSGDATAASEPLPMD